MPVGAIYHCSIRLKPAIPGPIPPIATLPVMFSVGVVPMILRVAFMCVPPTVIMEREYHAGILHFGTGMPTVAAAVARCISRSRYCAEIYGAAESQN